MKKFITDLGVMPGSEEPIPIYYDNNGTITQAEEPKSHQKSMLGLVSALRGGGG